MKKIVFALTLLFVVNAFTQDRFTHFINGSFLNPFESTAAEINAESGALFQDMQNAYSDILKVEQGLIAEKEFLNSHGLDAVDFLNRVEQMIAQLSPREKEILSKMDPSSPEFKTNAKIMEIQNFILYGREHVGRFFQKLDIYIQDTLDLSMAYGLHALRLHLAEVPRSLRSKVQVRALYGKLEHLRKKYVAHKNEYGKAKDTHRSSSFRKYFEELKSLYDVIETLNVGKNSKPVLARLQATFRTLYLTLLKIPEYASLAMSGLKLLKAAVLPKPATAEKLSLNMAINELMKKISRVQGLPVNLEGVENLPQSYDPKTINIFSASHRQSLTDILGLGQMGVENMVFFAAVNNFVPEFINKFFNLKTRIIGALNKNTGLIVVGKGANPQPIDKAMKIVTQTDVRNFLIFPGGRLPEGIGATMGVREKFAAADGLIGAFERAGFKVNLVPISMRHNARLFNSPQSLSDSTQVTVRIAKNVTDEARKVLTKLGGQESVGYLMRYGLIDDLVTNDTLIWGQVRASALPTVLDGYLNHKVNLDFCAKYFQ